MIGMWKIILLFIFVSGGTSDFVKHYHEDGYEIVRWEIADHPNRPCRAEEGWHRCMRNNVKVCVWRSLAPFNCNNHPRLKCTDNEVEIIQKRQHLGEKYTCMSKHQIRNLGEYKNIYLSCHPNEFECKISRNCIPRYFVQDGDDDCSIKTGYGGIKEVWDDSDEANFLPNCIKETEFRCNSGSPSRCIPRHWVMDNVTDCPNGEDEKAPLTCNNKTEFECAGSKRCILRRHVSDGVNDCPNNDDETIKNFTCIDRLEFSCEKINETGRCLPREWAGNKIIECSNGEGENDFKECADGEFKCIDNKRCLPRKYICDGNPNCIDGSDEVEPCTFPAMYQYKPQRFIPWSFILFESSTSIRTKYPDFQPQHDLTFGFKCYASKIVDGTKQVSTNLQHIPQFYITNNISVCSANEDRCFEGQTFTCARCLDGTIISKSQLCDNVIDCKDLSDECLCEYSILKELCENIFSFYHKPIEDEKSVNLVCNGKNDMKYEIDEEYCNKEVLNFRNVFSRKTFKKNATFTCSTGHIRNFRYSKYQTEALYCNGNLDCPAEEDECSSDCIWKIFENGEKVRKCFPFLHGPYANGGTLYNYSYSVSITEDGNEELYNHSANNESAPSETNQTICEYNIRKSSSRGWESRQLRSIINGDRLCRRRDDSYRRHDNLNFLCDIKGVKCPWIHYCDSNETLKVEISRRCDLKIDCSDKSDERGCSEGTHFYCKSGSPLFIPRSKVGDWRFDCSDSSDELKLIETALAAFASGTELVITLQVYACVLGLYIVICNGVVLRKLFRKIGKLPSKTTVAYCNTYLLIGLAISDAIFGFILITLGIKSKQYSGSISHIDLELISSLTSTCNMIGMFIVIASQTSVHLLLLMTGLRFYITYFPYMSNRINFNRVVVLSLLSFGISIFTASFPLWWNKTFINYFYFIKPTSFLKFYIVRPSDVKEYMRKTVIVYMHTHSNNSVTHVGYDSSFQKLLNWIFNSTQGKSEFPNRQIDIRGSLNSSSVCFLEYLPQSSSSSGYSLFIALYNLTALILISTGYLLIFKRARSSTLSVQTAGEERANKKIKKMMIKISLIVLNYMIFWLPVFIATILIYGGIELPKTAHPFLTSAFSTSTFSIVSTNSSWINPIIYFRLDKTIKRIVNRLLCPIWKRYCGKEREHRGVEQVEMQPVGNQGETS